MPSAFVLGAGLGTRLRPLTEHLPKPLVPVANRPLITYAFDHLLLSGTDAFIVNTHHCPETYGDAFPDGSYRGVPLTFRHEPVLLETGGGIANVADHLRGRGSFWVYNGDILTDLPLAPALAAHGANPDHEVTLVLRSSGPGRHIAFDPDSGRVTDIRDMLATGHPCRYQFTGIYLVRECFLDRLPDPPEKVSVIPHFLDLAKAARLGGVVVDAGHWRDLGDPEAYREAHRALVPTPLVDPAARVAAGVRLEGSTAVGAGATVGRGARLTDTIVWPGAVVAPGAHLSNQIVQT